MNTDNYSVLKSTTIGEFRQKFFNKEKIDEELMNEFTNFTNIGNKMTLYNDYIHAYCRYLLQEIYDETQIGENIGRLPLLKARYKQAEKDLEELLEGEKKEKKEEFTEISFVEWVSAVSKYYGYEITDNKSMFDFLVMTKKMNKDFEEQKKELDKIKSRRNGK